MAMQRDRDVNTSTGTRRRSAKRDIISRIKSLYTAFILLGIVIAARLVWVQVASPSVRHNADIMGKGILRTRTIEAHRGAILSRDGEPLAISSLRYSIALDFASEGIRDADTMAYRTHADSLAKMLANLFNEADAREEGYEYRSAAYYRDVLFRQRRLGKARSYNILPRSVTIDEWNMMHSTFPILNGNMGMVYSATSTEKRLYPSGDLGRQIIGRYDTLVVNGRKVPGTGIELIYNEHLAGSDGKVKEQWIAHGFWTRVSHPDNRLSEDGCDIVTTIDAGLQRMTHERLDSALRNQHASFGVAMVMEVKTGNILCMVNLSSGRVRGTNYTERVYNHALKTAMTPGSTFKLMAAMALVEKCGYGIDNVVEIPKAEQVVGTRRVVDTHLIKGEDNKPLVDITLRDGFAHSSNIYFAKSIYENYKDAPSEYTDFLRKLRIDDYVGLEEYGEKRGSLPEPGSKVWNTIHGNIHKTLPYLGYGYIVELPPIHTLTFYNGVANEGCMVAPRLVDRIERGGEVIEEMPVVTLVDKMCSRRTLDVLDECLRAAATPERSSYKFCDLPFNVGCKTGTAQILGNFNSEALLDKEAMTNGLNRDDGYYLGSVICTMPEENPKYTIMVAVAKQRTSTHPTYYGISLSGGTAHDIMEYLYANDPTLHATLEVPEQEYVPTNLKGGRSSHVERVGRRLLPEYVDETKDNKWCRTSTDKEGAVTLRGIDVKAGVVPDVRGMGLSDALYLLESLGLNVEHSGVGQVSSQSIRAGTAITPATSTIHLTLTR